jgi:hypothetical protein
MGRKFRPGRGPLPMQFTHSGGMVSVGRRPRVPSPTRPGPLRGPGSGGTLRRARRSWWRWPRGRATATSWPRRWRASSEKVGPTSATSTGRFARSKRRVPWPGRGTSSCPGPQAGLRAHRRRQGAARRLGGVAAGRPSVHHRGFGTLRSRGARMPQTKGGDHGATERDHVEQGQRQERGCCGPGCCGRGYGQGARWDHEDEAAERRASVGERRRDLEQQLADVTGQLQGLGAGPA